MLGGAKGFIVRYLGGGYYILVMVLLFLSFVSVRRYHYERSKSSSFLFSFARGIQNKIDILFTTYDDLLEANESISAENAVLMSKLALLKEDTFDSLGDVGFGYIGSKVIKNSYAKNDNYIILNKGRRQGVEPYMGVISNKGIVGIVKDVSDNFCSVLSVLNTHSKIHSKLKGTGFTGTILRIEGDFRNVSLEDIPTHASLSVGDTVVTAGGSLIFPENIYIGLLSDFSKNNKTYGIEVELFNDFTNIEYVYIIRSNLKKELDSLIVEE